MYYWHKLMMKFHYRMCYVWNMHYHYGKWMYHRGELFEIKRRNKGNV